MMNAFFTKTVHASNVLSTDLAREHIWTDRAHEHISYNHVIFLFLYVDVKRQRNMSIFFFVIKSKSTTAKLKTADIGNVIVAVNLIIEILKMCFHAWNLIKMCAAFPKSYSSLFPIFASINNVFRECWHFPEHSSHEVFHYCTLYILFWKIGFYSIQWEYYFIYSSSNGYKENRRKKVQVVRIEAKGSNSNFDYNFDYYLYSKCFSGRWAYYHMIGHTLDDFFFFFSRSRLFTLLFGSTGIQCCKMGKIKLAFHFATFVFRFSFGFVWTLVWTIRDINYFIRPQKVWKTRMNTYKKKHSKPNQVYNAIASNIGFVSKKFL